VSSSSVSLISLSLSVLLFVFEELMVAELLFTVSWFDIVSIVMLWVKIDGGR
jgi:hypothetical protein